ncbi:hypothetical protein ACFWGE_10380 [Streptomyces bacillaris]|uniref:hypothetical protein n=1 Tax=Streptomyces bacillaris TaxID=68179 RepID=UPI00363195A1
MTRAAYAAEVTVSDGQRYTCLGTAAVRNRRLVLLWLRRQALRLANAHGNRLPLDGDPPPPTATSDARAVVFHGTDAPESLRHWATTGQLQDDAIRTLEAGFPLHFTVLDPAVGLSLTLAGWHAFPGHRRP